MKRTVWLAAALAATAVVTARAETVSGRVADVDPASHSFTIVPAADGGPKPVGRRLVFTDERTSYSGVAGLENLKEGDRVTAETRTEGPSRVRQALRVALHGVSREEEEVGRMVREASRNPEPDMIGDEDVRKEIAGLSRGVLPESPTRSGFESAPADSSAGSVPSSGDPAVPTSDVGENPPGRPSLD